MELRFNDTVEQDRARVSAALLADAFTGAGEHATTEIVDGVLVRTFLLREKGIATQLTVGSVIIWEDGTLVVRLGHEEHHPTSGYNNGLISVDSVGGGHALIAFTGGIGDVSVAGPFGPIALDTWLGSYKGSRDSEQVEQPDYDDSFNF